MRVFLEIMGVTVHQKPTGPSNQLLLGFDDKSIGSDDGETQRRNFKLRLVSMTSFTDNVVVCMKV
jgi:hypothetical protein